MNLLSELRNLFQPVLEQLSPDPSKLADYLAMVRQAQNPEHGDYQANFAMPLAKLLKRKPPEVAAEVLQKLPPNDLIESTSVAGPGFINIRLKNYWLAKQVRAMAADARLGIAPAHSPKTYVIDYSGPNVAKPLHVGHLRSTIIGEALCRLLRFLGHNVIGDNHLGDWGTQFGMLLYGYKNFRDDAAYKADPVRELARLYRHVRELAKANDDDEGDANNPVAQAYRAETVKLHAGDPENVALWKQFMPACMEEVEAIYRRLDVHFDHQHGESFYNPMLADVVKDLLEKNCAERSDDAVIIRESKDKVSLIQKRDGAYTYTTTDLATIKYRHDTWKPNVVLCVVDFRQGDHFKNLFAAAKRWGYDSVELTHVSFGSVLGEDRKPFQTRAGKTVELDMLLDKAVELGLQKYEEAYQERLTRDEDLPQLSDAEKKEIAEVVGIGAVKYADLSQNRTSDYVFSYEKMLATDGNTATYMQYAYARCRSIFRKGEIDVERFQKSPPPVSLESPHERALALQLLRWSEALDAAATEYMPHYLTGYLWDLSKAYSSFFVNCPVLKAETPALRDSRLLLCDLTARVIRETLNLLGIRTVERM
jgi:arginyl-tRNA synthetase